eukprot:7749089-Alexandrium_andersonii.AAC.1
MSASLVGSEMCIRDRGWRCCRWVVPGTAGAVGWLSLDGFGRWQSGRLPVSYTHLTLPTICSV